jgi:voltage-gated potassium channel
MKNRKIKEKLAFLLNDSATLSGKIIDLSLLFINFCACGLYVYRSYLGDVVPWWIKVSEILIMSLFTVEYGVRIWIAKSRTRYIFSFYGIIDLLSIIPFVVFFIKNLSFFSALKILRVLRFLRFLETETFFFGKISRFQLQVWRTIFSIVIILFVFSGFILAAEAFAAQPEINTFDEAFYYCAITLSTVGYGDFTPVTTLGRALTILMIAGGAILVPWQAGKLVHMLIRGDLNKSSATCPKCGLIGHDADAVHCKACGAVIFQKYEGQ